MTSSSSNVGSPLKPGGSTGPLASADRECSICDDSLCAMFGGSIGPNIRFSEDVFSGFV